MLVKSASQKNLTGQESFREQTAATSDGAVAVIDTLMEMSFRDTVGFEQPEDRR